MHERTPTTEAEFADAVAEENWPPLQRQESLPYQGRQLGCITEGEVVDLGEDPVVESLKGSFLVHGHALHYLQPKALLASPQELLAVIVDDVHTLKGSEEPRHNISARLSTQATQLLLAELKLGKKVGSNLEGRKKELTPYNLTISWLQ